MVTDGFHHKLHIVDDASVRERWLDLTSRSGRVEKSCRLGFESIPARLIEEEKPEMKFEAELGRWEENWMEHPRYLT